MIIVSLDNCCLSLGQHRHAALTLRAFCHSFTNIVFYCCLYLCLCVKGQRRSNKSPTVLSPPAKPSKSIDQTGASATTNQLGAGAGATADEQVMSDVERNVVLQQQREHLQAQLALQQQLHNELQQHLKLQQEHHQLQTQLMVTNISIVVIVVIGCGNSV